MKSKIHLGGHPIHPMLIPIPITCAIGALVADIVARSIGSNAWFFMSYVLTIGAWGGGLLAALPGLADYFFAVPSKTKAKRDATIHLLLNLCIVGLFFASWIVKNSETANKTRFTGFTPLILEIIGVVFLMISGWFGWTLVYQHRMGIEERTPAEVASRKIA